MAACSEKVFLDIWVQPASGDAGGALGAALSIWYEYLEKPRTAEKVTVENVIINSMLIASPTDFFLSSSNIAKPRNNTLNSNRAEKPPLEYLPNSTSRCFKINSTISFEKNHRQAVIITRMSETIVRGVIERVFAAV
jgi:hypothetical protein